MSSLMVADGALVVPLRIVSLGVYAQQFGPETLIDFLLSPICILWVTSLAKVSVFYLYDPGSGVISLCVFRNFYFSCALNLGTWNSETLLKFALRVFSILRLRALIVS